MTASETAPSDASVPVADITTDAFLGGAVMLRQPRQGYRAGLDPVLLAAACSAADGQHAVDLGAGVGAVGLCLARRVPGVEVTLVEREPVYATLARDNVAANRVTDRARVLVADVTMPLSQSPALATLVGRCDHVLANPPYFTAGRGTPAPHPLKTAAHSMPADGFDAWARVAAALLRADGQFHLIHRVEALSAILAALDRRFGAVRIHPVQATPDSGATRVLVCGTRGSRAPLSFGPALVIHAADGSFTPRIEAVLRHGAPLDLSGG